MSSEKTTHGHDPENIAAMLRMGTEADEAGEMSSSEVKEELLGRMLRATLPPTRQQVHELSVLVGQFRDRLPLRGRALGEALLDEETELDKLVEIKEHGKELSRDRAEAERDTALTVYYGAIASAIVFHGQRITSYSYAALADAFGQLVEKRWMAPKLARLFSKARKACEKLSK